MLDKISIAEKEMVSSLSNTVIVDGKGENVLVSSPKCGLVELCEMLMVTALITHIHVFTIFSLLYMRLKSAFSNLH